MAELRISASMIKQHQTHRSQPFLGSGQIIAESPKFSGKWMISRALIVQEAQKIADEDAEANGQ